MEKWAWLSEDSGVIDRQNWVDGRQAAVLLRLLGHHDKQEQQTNKRLTEKEQLLPRLAPLDLIMPSYPKTSKSQRNNYTLITSTYITMDDSLAGRGFSRMKTDP